MADLQGIATFPGVAGFIDAVCPVTDGISPSVFRLRIPPQRTSLPEYGELVLTFGDVVICFVDCKVDYGSIQFNEAGEIWEFSIFDRRWKWRFGEVCGQWNMRNPDGTIIEATRQMPQDLATACLWSMGELSWDVGDLPNDFPPEVYWDYVNPAEALTRLCESLGCRVCPYLTGHHTTIRRCGEGAELPQGGVIDIGLTFDSPEKPQRLGVLCGKTRFQVELPLEAVGIEADFFGTIKPVYALGYQPAAGFAKCALDFAAVEKEWGRKAYDLAKQSVWKCYRVYIPEGGLTIPGYPKPITSLRQLQLEDTLVRMDGEADNDQSPDPIATTVNSPRRLPAYVYGEWWHGCEGNLTDTVAPALAIGVGVPEYPGEQWTFAVDAEHRMVKFDRAIYKNTSATELLPAEADLTLVTCVTILDPDNHAVVRNGQLRELSGEAETGILWLEHPEIIFEYENGELTAATRDLALPEAHYYLDVAVRRYDSFQAQTASYVGLVPIALDGAIRQVTYSIGERGTTTSISRNTEQYPAVIPWQQRRAWEKQREAERERERAKKEQQAANR